MTASSGETVTFSFEAGVVGWVLSSLLSLAWLVLIGLIKTNKIRLARADKTKSSAAVDLRVLTARNAFLDRVECDADPRSAEPEKSKPNRFLVSPGGENLPSIAPYSDAASSTSFYSADGTASSSEPDYSEIYSEYRI